MPSTVSVVVMVWVVPAGHKFPAWEVKAQRNVAASKVWMKFMMV